MNKLYASIIALVVLAGVGGYFTHRPATRVVKQISAVKAQPQALHYIGSSQQGVTLQTVYAPATPLTAMDEVDPQSTLIAVRVLGADYSDLHSASLVYTSAAEYLKPLGGNVKECSDCAVFIVPNSELATVFIYKDAKWYL